jgi:hypothetical protein
VSLGRNQQFAEYKTRISRRSRALREKGGWLGLAWRIISKNVTCHAILGCTKCQLSCQIRIRRWLESRYALLMSQHHDFRTLLKINNMHAPFFPLGWRTTLKKIDVWQKSNPRCCQLQIFRNIHVRNRYVFNWI